MRNYRPTDEQVEAVRLFGTGGSLAIEAGAGSGKTTTLSMMARANPLRRGQYVAFNKSLVDDGAGKFGPSVSLNTAHSLAFRAVGHKYKARLFDSARMTNTDIANRLGLSPMEGRSFDGKRKILSAAVQAGIVNRAVTRFCQSADPQIEPHHVGVPDGLSPETETMLRRELVPYAKKMWIDLSVPVGWAPYKHEHYLKTWQLSGPRIAADYVLFDEAQDANPVIAAIVAAQTKAQLVYVGDSNQAIYQWNGAIDALARVKVEHRAFLTQSFRFGEEIAERANEVLDDLDADIRLTGSPWVESSLGRLSHPSAILTRTNAIGVSTLIRMQSQGIRAHYVGGAADLLGFSRAAQQLKDTGRTSYAELVCFDSWEAVLQYIKEDEGGDDLRMMVNLVEQFGTDVIEQALQSSVPEKSAQVVISTAHKCVAPDTLVEHESGLIPISSIPDAGIIATPDGARSYLGLFRLPETDMLTIRAHGGFEVSVTPEHGMSKCCESGIERVRADGLAIGDVLRVRLGCTIEPASEVVLPDAPSSGDARERRHRLPPVLVPDVAELLGLLVADGTIWHGGFRLAKRYESVVRRFVGLCADAFAVEARVFPVSGALAAEVQSVFLARWLLSLGGLAPNAKDVPNVVLRSPMGVQAAFLRGLFEDGSVNVRDGGKVDHIHWENRDPRVAAVVQTMLLRFGIIATRRTHHGVTSLYLYAQHARLFAERIGFVAPEKNKRASGPVGRSLRFAVPFSEGEIAEMRSRGAIHGSAPGNWRRSGGWLSRDTAERALSLAPDLTWIGERLDWHYVRVESIEQTRSEAWCLTVPDGERFLQNGFDGWNSKGREWDSVLLAEDFGRKKDAKAAPPDLRLLYVAVTRAKHVLDDSVVASGPSLGLETA